MTREVRRVVEDYPASPVALASLGIVSALARLDRLLDEYAPDADAAARAHDSPPSQGVYFVLGLVAFRARVAELLDELAPLDAVRAEAPTAPSDAEHGESLWR